MYRAKFRVLSRTEESTLRRGEDNVYRQSPAFTITMRPVSPRHQWNHQSDDVSVENSSFFEASPSGEFSMQLFPEEAEQFTVGQAVFVDFEPNPEGSWGFGALHIENGANVKLQLYRRSGSGSFHIDARVPGAGECRTRFPSNWELSGARAGAALRRLMCVDGSCDSASLGEAEKLRTLAQDRDRLQLVAAGRADSMPAWRALCAPDWPGAAIDAELDADVCGALSASEFSASARADKVTALIGSSRIPAARTAVTSFDQALVAWANDPRCAGGGGPAGACDERFRRLRRVDMRVDLRPRAKE